MYWIIYQHLSVSFIQLWYFNNKKSLNWGFSSISHEYSGWWKPCQKCFLFSGHISGRPGVPAKGHLARSRTKWGESEKWSWLEVRTGGEEIKKLSPLWEQVDSHPPPSLSLSLSPDVLSWRKSQWAVLLKVEFHSLISYYCCCLRNCCYCCRTAAVALLLQCLSNPFSKLQNFPPFRTLVGEKEADSNSYTHWFSIKQRGCWNKKNQKVQEGVPEKVLSEISHRSNVSWKLNQL